MALTKTLIAAGFGIALAQTALAAPVNGTGNITANVLFGSGNANGSWTGVNTGAVELALRGKLRYDNAGNPQNTFNYDGDRTYTFDPANSAPQNGNAIFNFEFAINTDVTDTDGTPDKAVGAYIYELTADSDPSVAVSPFDIGPFGGNVVQDSLNLGFYETTDCIGLICAPSTWWSARRLCHCLRHCPCFWPVWADWAHCAAAPRPAARDHTRPLTSKPCKCSGCVWGSAEMRAPLLFERVSPRSSRPDARSPRPV